MSLDADPGGLRNVVVGATYDEAATVFGRYFDGAVLLTYDDFGEQVDLGLLGSLGLVAGEGLTRVLPRVLAHQSMQKSGSVRILVGLPPDLRGRDSVRAVLAGHPGLGLTPVAHAGPEVLLELVADGPSSVDLDALAAAPPPPATRKRDRAPAEAERDAGSPAAAPRGAADTLRRRVRQRPRAAAAAVVGLSAVLVVLLLVLVAATDWGLTGVVVLTGALVVAGQVLLLMAFVAVMRLLREQNHDRDRDRDLLQKRTDRLLRLTREGHRRQRQQAATVESSLASLAPTPGRVLALGRLLARSDASARERARPSDPDHEAADAEFLLAGVETLLRERPDVVLCCGGGQVAVALGLAADRHGVSTRITLVEHDAPAAHAVRATLRHLQLDDRVEVRRADGTGPSDEAALAGLHGVALLLVPAQIGDPAAAQPAFAPVTRTLAQTCTVLVARRSRPEADPSAPDWSALLPGFEDVDASSAHYVRLARTTPGPS